MAGKLPYDDEQDMLSSSDNVSEDDASDIADQTMSEEPDYENPYVNGMDTRPEAALKYFTQPNNTASLIDNLTAYNPNPEIKETAQETPRIEQPRVTAAPSNPQESLLEDYKRMLKEKQSKNSNLDLQLGANQIAQAIASGYGGKVGDGSEAIKTLKATNNIPIEQLLAQRKLLSGMVLTPYQQMMLDINNRKLNQGAQRIEQGEQRLGLNENKFTDQKSVRVGKIAQDFEKALDTMKLSKNSEAGRAAFSLGAARQLELITNSRPKGDFTDAEVEEIANMANRMLTGGSSSARSAVEALVPKTMTRQFANWKTYLLNDPQSVEAKEFVKVFKKLADREKEYSTNVLNKYMKSKAPAFKELADKSPQVYNDILDSKFQLLGAVNETPSKSLSDIAKENKAVQTGAVTGNAPTEQTSNEVKRMTSDGRVAIFDAKTKKFLRYEK